MSNSQGFKPNQTYGSSMFERPALKPDWEAQPMNDRNYYLESPVAKFSRTRGDFSEDKFISRTFNRRMRMKDTFTNVIPLYTHEPRTCYISPYSHFIHPKYKKDILGQPLKK